MKFAFSLVAAAALLAGTAGAQVKITSGPEKISVQINGKPFTAFYVGGPDVTKPYLWPLLAPSGTAITRNWPMAIVDEEKTTKLDHQHQRGLWFAHDSVNGIDFWNNEARSIPPTKEGQYKSPKLGRITLTGPVAVKSGKTQGTIAAKFDWKDLQGNKLLTESRVMTFYADKLNRVFDVDITLTAAVKPVTFGDGKDGALGIRMRPILQEDAGGHITNADGLQGEKDLWGKPSNWCDYSGAINGEKVGVAILDNPANPRHPVRWHARAYGLFAANPFGLSVFTNDKSQNGATTIQPGQSLRYRYRVIIHPGDANSAKIAAAWMKYSGEKVLNDVTR
jgi:hypothetical protein